MSYFPYDKPRPAQTALLQAIERDFDKHDVFCIVAPTGVGKSALSYTIAHWASQFGTSRITTPTNQLVEQFASEFPEVSTIVGFDNYVCDKYTEYSCNSRGASCSNCPLASDKQRFATSAVTMCNNHMHAANLRRNPWLNAPNTLICDEAHNLIPFQRDWNSVYMFQHTAGYPHWDQSPQSILSWLARQRKLTNVQMKLKQTLTSKRPQYLLGEDEAEWKGGGYSIDGQKLTRGEVTIEPRLKLSPIDVTQMGDSIWPRRTNKIVLMSATIGRKDIESLGLNKRRVRYLECAHVIPAAQRPVVLDYVASINYSNLEESTRKICEHIESSGLLEFHANQKGLIHATYKQSKLMQQYFTSDRMMFHNADNKHSIYREWLNSPPSQGKILIASGMYEGVDLSYELGRFQIVCKIPWGNMHDPVIAYHLNSDQWYEWETLKSVIQACGRISRSENDYGTTYIMDSTFEKLRNSELAPNWFAEAIIT